MLVNFFNSVNQVYQIDILDYIRRNQRIFYKSLDNERENIKHYMLYTSRYDKRLFPRSDKKGN